MKRTATLVAGLLLVTGTVFAAPTVTATGSVEYKNTVFATDKAVLQHNQARTDWDGQGFKAVVGAKFDDKNSLELTVTDLKNDPDTALKYTYKGTETTVTALTENLFSDTKFTAVNEKGRVKAQVMGTLHANIYEGSLVKVNANADLAPTKPNGTTEFTLTDDDDATFLQYKVTDKVTTTFYPYRTKYASADTVFTDDAKADEIYGLGADFEKVQSAAGVKVEGYGITAKVGTGATNKGTTQDTTYVASAQYDKTIGALSVTVGGAASTITAADAPNTGVRGAKSSIGAIVKYKGTVNVEADLLNVQGTAKAGDFTGLYAAADTKVAGVNLIAKASSRKFGTDDAYLGVYLEANKTLAAVNGVVPTVTVSYKDVNTSTTTAGKAAAGTLTGKVEAKVTRDNITVTPALEIANADNGSGSKTTTTGTVAVKYSF